MRTPLFRVPSSRFQVTALIALFAVSSLSFAAPPPKTAKPPLSSVAAPVAPQKAATLTLPNHVTYTADQLWQLLQGADQAVRQRDDTIKQLQADLAKAREQVDVLIEILATWKTAGKP